MCYSKFHTCKYCGNEYSCELKNHICPTINGDIDRNMCLNCRAEIEKKINENEISELKDDIYS